MSLRGHSYRIVRPDPGAKSISTGSAALNTPSEKGFTLIEMAVVVTIISGMLFLGLPRLKDMFLINDADEVALRLTKTIRKLKTAAVVNGENYYLHMDMKTGKFYGTYDSMKPEDAALSERNAHILPAGFGISDIEVPGLGKISGDVFVLGFYPSGYSDRAVIHLEDDETGYSSYIIEPFLFRVAMKNSYARPGD